MPTPDVIAQLVERFDQQRQIFRSGKYNETRLRREFLDPFFDALGWDMTNRHGVAEIYKEVIHEDSLEFEGENKAPDYAFRIAGTRKFFVEAKKPAVNIEFNIHPAFQLRRYAWSAKLPLGILTDFEEFAVYDCRVKPDKHDKASTGRILLLSYKDYIDKWDQISSVFSREAILRGSFDAYADALKSKKGTTEVDDAFLAEIERWRELLAKNVALRNPNLTARELNYAVQMTIDRIVFLRICEDRGIERYEQLKEISEEKNIYNSLCQLFQRADARYNSGLFHFINEGEQSSGPDSLTLKIKIDDRALHDILGNLYFPESPYVFREIPSDILGQVYERFLGKVIRLTDGHQARIEEKPEVRKAGGVYYTPTFIVDYIVQNTVGKLLEEKTPKEVAKLKILDPACGSGTFPLGAYQYLLDWHLQWYTVNELEKSLTGRKPVIYQSKDGYQLTTAKKKEILLNNIFGVDIDPQAVEVTKLSLLLKVLEGESQETIGSQLSLLQERVLPDLGKNIQCGNSLIGTDYYELQQLRMGFADPEEGYRVNAFDWKNAFPQVFFQGGFDVVIGNPPYLRIQGLQENYNNQVQYFIKTYKSAVKRFDLYLLFIERAFQLLGKNGRLGFICPHKFINSDFGSGLRGVLLKNSSLERIISFGNNLIFKQATTYTGLIFLINKSVESFEYYEFDTLTPYELRLKLFQLSSDDFASYKSSDFSASPWVLTKKSFPAILNTIAKNSQSLGDICDEILVGIQSGIDNIHILKYEAELPEEDIKLFSERAGRSVQIERGLLKPLMRGEDVHRYKPPTRSFYCIYPYKLINGRTTILEETELRKTFPKGFAYLNEYRRELTEIRKRQKTNPVYWYSCHRSRDMRVFETERIVTPEISFGGNMTLAPGGMYNNTQVYSIVPKNDFAEGKLYLLGILNSKLLWWFLTNTGTTLRGGYFRFKTNYLAPFPIRRLNFSENTDQARQEKMRSFVGRMLDLHRRNPRTPQEEEMIKREIWHYDMLINDLVYELYGLTEDERKIVEGKAEVNSL